MRCNNCGTIFEGTACPECGDCPQAESSEGKISENEIPENPKIGENEFSKSPKKSGKPQSAFAKSLKANKKFFIIVAVFLILLIVLGSSLTAVLIDDFRIGKIKKITIGMPKEFVRINLGEPHEIEENETWWKYYSPKYKKFLENAKDDADFSEKKAAFVHNEIRITFSDEKVYAVEMLKDFSENTKDAKKEIKKVQLSRNSIHRYTYFEGELYAAIQYKDGSFKNAPVTLTKQPNTVNLGINRVSWYDEWSRSEITNEITVVPNPDIYLRGRLPGTEVRYLGYEIEGGYALEIFGSGTIATTAAEYPWDEIKNKLLYLKVSEGITQIENNAFNDYDALLSAELPESLTSIGSQAFYNCSNLKNIIIPDSVTSIGSKAFGNCSNLKNINFPDSLTYVGADAFLYTPWYSDQPNGLVYVGNVLYEFKGRMPADTKITIKEGTVSIADRAFYNYYGLEENGLTEIEIPSSVTSIGNEAFRDCSSLVSVEIPSSVTSIGFNAFANCSSLASVEIPSGVTYIGNSAFYNCRSLVSVVIPEGVTSISSNAFDSCSSLVSVEIPSGVTSIGYYAFVYCSSLESIEIPNSVTSIGSSAFLGCSSLVSVKIPSGVTSIGSSAFYNCYSLTIYAEASAKPSGWDSSWNSSDRPVVWDCKNNDVADDGFIHTVQNGIRYGIKDGAATVVRQPRNITTVNILSEIVCKDKTYKVTSIGSSAFYNCSSLVSVVIGNGVTSIGSYAFRDCSSLVSIEIPNSVTRIGEYAFAGCNSLVSVVIGNGVTSIGYGAFRDCSSLKNIIIGNGVTSIGSSAFSGCSSLKSIIIGNGVTSIGYGAFSGCSSLETITVAEGNTKYHSAGNCLIETETKTLIAGCKNSIIPTDGSVTSIGSSAFEGCSSLVSVEIPSSVTSIGDYAFYECSSLVSIVIPSSVTSIGNRAFSNCTSLVSVVIPNSVTSIGSSAFSGCSSIETITVAEGNTKYHSAGNCLIETETKTLIAGCKNSIIPTDGSVTSIGDSAFYDCSSLVSIEIPSGVTSIGNYAFYNCSSLVSVEIPSGVTSIGSSAFSGCSSLKSIIIGNGVTSIGDNAFTGCISLESIAIPNSVTSINSYAFSGCGNLESIEYGGMKEEWIKIRKSSGWNYNTGNYTVTCSNGTLTKTESQA